MSFHKILTSISACNAGQVRRVGERKEVHRSTHRQVHMSRHIETQMRGQMGGNADNQTKQLDRSSPTCIHC